LLYLKMKFILIIMISIFSLSGFSQKSTANSNVWFGLMYQQGIGVKSRLISDVGYRTFHFLQNSRTVFGRLLVEKTILKNTTFGLGYALFDNYSFSKEKFLTENRPFMNLQYRWKKDRNEFLFRNRNEWRIYEKGIRNVLRFRFQFVDEYQFSKIKLRTAFEYLASSDRNNEQRYTFGLLIPMKNHIVNIFYALNRQDVIKINEKTLNQHVLGIQFQITK
jgi:hypothetical protein